MISDYILTQILLYSRNSPQHLLIKVYFKLVLGMNGKLRSFAVYIWGVVSRKFNVKLIRLNSVLQIETNDMESPPAGSRKRRTIYGVTSPGVYPSLRQKVPQCQLGVPQTQSRGYPCRGEPIPQAGPVIGLGYPFEHDLWQDWTPPPGKDMGPEVGKGPGTRSGVPPERMWDQRLERYLGP